MSHPQPIPYIIYVANYTPYQCLYPLRVCQQLIAPIVKSVGWNTNMTENANIITRDETIWKSWANIDIHNNNLIIN